MKVYPQDVLEKLVKRLNGAFCYSETLELSAAGMLTVKTEKGRYKKLPFVGGERFSYGGAWAGKSGRVVLVFNPIKMPMDEYERMEITHDKLATVFPSLYQALTEFLTLPIGDYLDAYGEVAKEQEQAEQEQAHKDDYGPSWGLFG